VVLRCLTVDDNPGFLHSASALLESGGLRVIGVASTAEEAVGRVTGLSPDVTLVDVELDGESGFDLVRRLLRRRPAAGTSHPRLGTCGGGPGRPDRSEPGHRLPSEVRSVYRRYRADRARRRAL